MTGELQLGFMVLPRSAEQTPALARLADDAGYSWLGVADSPSVYQESYLHQLLALQNSRRLRVGPLVSHVVARHPLIVGNSAATLNEAGAGRSRLTLGTGNSAARGLGMRPATVRDLGQAVAAIRGYWAGDGGTFRDSAIPPTGIRRAPPELFLAADGPRVTALAGECADGVLYGGTLNQEVLDRRVQSGRRRADQQFWVGPAVSLGETVDEVLEDIGAMVVAMANRAFRGDLTERAIPRELHQDVATMWQRYDYAFHADTTRPRNAEVVSRPLAEYLVHNFVVWGDEARWAERFAALRRAGCAGVHFILGQSDQLAAVRGITDRLRALGELPAPADEGGA